MVNVTKAVTHPPQTIIEHTNLWLFRYDDYLADDRAKILSFVVQCCSGWCVAGWTLQPFRLKVGEIRRSATIGWSKLFIMERKTASRMEGYSKRIVIKENRTHASCCIPKREHRSYLSLLPRTFILTSLRCTPAQPKLIERGAHTCPYKTASSFYVTPSSDSPIVHPLHLSRGVPQLRLLFWESQLGLTGRLVSAAFWWPLLQLGLPWRGESLLLWGRPPFLLLDQVPLRLLPPFFVSRTKAKQDKQIQILPNGQQGFKRRETISL